MSINFDAGFRFIAVDVETANYDVSSICQIGLAFVNFDASIDTYSTYVDPCTSFADGNTRLHGIDARTVRGAPVFAQILPELRSVLEAHQLVQHSRFDEKAFDQNKLTADVEKKIKVINIKNSFNNDSFTLNNNKLMKKIKIKNNVLELKNECLRISKIFFNKK